MPYWTRKIWKNMISAASISLFIVLRGTFIELLLLLMNWILVYLKGSRFYLDHICRESQFYMDVL